MMGKVSNRSQSRSTTTTKAVEGRNHKVTLNDSKLLDACILPWMEGFEKRYAPGEHIEDVVKCVCGYSCPDEEEEREMVQCDRTFLSHQD